MFLRAAQRSYWPVWFTVAIYSVLILMQGLQPALLQIYSEIEIALTMALGSFVAGGTALGGGAVAFPVMTKMLDIDPASAKIFSLAIQSFGMTAASLTIICRGIPFYRNIVFMALPLASLGVILSLLFIAPTLPRLWVKSIFSVLLLCFGVTMLIRWWRKAHHTPSVGNIKPNTVRLMLISLAGGIASGLVGSGADIALFALLILCYNADVKKATATSVLVMACTSVVGSCINAFYLGQINSEIQNYLLAAIPVVIIGAPFGAYVCAKIKVGYVVAFLLTLIIIESVVTGYELLSS